MLDGKLIACDTETTGLRIWKGDRPFMFSFCNEDMETAVVEWPVDPFTRQVLPRKRELRELKRWFERTDHTTIWHNSKFDVRAIENGYGIRVAGPGGPVTEGGALHDTMIMAFCSHTLENNYKLKDLAFKYCRYTKADETELKNMVRRLRRKASKEGWKIAYEHKAQIDGTTKKKAAIEADYWLPAAAAERSPRWFLSPEHRADAAGICSRYAVGDVRRTMMLYQLYDGYVMDREGVRATYSGEMELWPVVYRMETRGVRVDEGVIEDEMAKSRSEVRDSYKTVLRAAWPGFNINSSVHMRKLLYDPEYQGLSTDGVERTKTGLPSTAFSAGNMGPAAVVHADPVLHALVKCKTAGKAWGSFYDRYRDLMVDDLISVGGKVLHPDYQQCGPVTGRFACRTPNLQNVPVVGTTMATEPIYARKPFGPRPGYVWLHMDFKGMEIYIFADCSGDRFMLEQVEGGRDVPDEVSDIVFGGEGNPLAISTAIHALELDGSGQEDNPKIREVWNRLGVPKGIDRKDIIRLPIGKREAWAAAWLESFGWSCAKSQKSLGLKSARARAKQLIYCKLYCGGAETAKKLLQAKDVAEAKAFLDKFTAEFPDMQNHIRRRIREAKRDGFIRTKYGRVLRVHPDFAYTAVNYEIQGTAADILKRAMVRCDRWLREGMVDGHLVMTIHDELVFEVRRTHATRRVVRGLKELMEDTEGRLRIKMAVEVEKAEHNWLTKTKVNL